MNRIRTRLDYAGRSTPSYNPYKPSPKREVFRGSDPVDTDELYQLRLAFVALQAVITDRHASEAIDIQWPMSPNNETRFSTLIAAARDLGDLCDAIRLEEERYLKKDA